MIHLIELDRVRQRMQNGLKQLTENGKIAMMQACANCDAAFGDEWAKRMLARTNLNDYVNLTVRVYEKYFTDDEIMQYTALVDKKNARPPSLSPALKARLTSMLPSLQSEIMGGSVQIGSKLGAEIGQEIQKEHPEYFKQPAKVK